MVARDYKRFEIEEAVIGGKNFICLITHIKSSKIVLSGQPENSWPLAIKLKGFFIFILKRRIFKNYVVLIN